MKAVSFTCLRDIDSVLRLNRQLEELAVDHFMFVEEDEFSEFSKIAKCYSRGNNANGTNGFGGAGTIAKLNMYKELNRIIDIGIETVLDVDSDVSFNNSKAVYWMNCVPGEMRGYYELKEPIHSIDHKPFIYFTGCCKSYSSEIFKALCEAEDIEEHIEKMAGHKITPSEDAFFSYYCQNVLGAKPVNLHFTFKHGKQTKQYDNKEWDLVS